MKRILFLSVMLVLACLCISACSCQSEESVTVTFENYTGEKIPAKTVLVGERIDEPDISKERAGYVFIGWFNGDKLWDFRADTVTQDIILTARWEKYLSFAEATDGSGGLWVTGCLFDAVNVVIPSEYNGRAVTGIYQGFADRTAIQSVIIPNTVTYISENAFAGCTGLKEIHIPKSVTKFSAWVLFIHGDAKLIFEGDCPELIAGQEKLTGTPTIYYHPGTNGWDSCVWKDDYPLKPID